MRYLVVLYDIEEGQWKEQSRLTFNDAKDASSAYIGATMEASMKNRKLPGTIGVKHLMVFEDGAEEMLSMYPTEG